MTTLETAQKLKEAGFPWRSITGIDLPPESYQTIPIEILLAELPARLGNCYELHLIKQDTQYIVGYETDKGKPYRGQDFYGDKDPAEALALLWLSLKEEGLI